LKNILGHLNTFKYASQSVNQLEKFTIQNEAELNRGHKIYHLRFLFSYVGMATMVAILLLICCCFCKKCNLLRRFLEDDYCGRICTRQTVINGREVKSSDENVRFSSQQTHSQGLAKIPSSFVDFYIIGNNIFVILIA
jgi:hypothetical protein